MSTPPPDQTTGAASPAQEWPPPGEVAALEPDTIPNHPLRALDCQALLSKEIG